MTKPQPNDLIAEAPGFEIHPADGQPGFYWLGHTYQGDHCAPTDRLTQPPIDLANQLLAL